MNLHISKQKIPTARWQVAIDVACLLVIVALFVFVKSRFAELPNLVPTHFNFQGLPDSYAETSSIYTLPGVALFVYVMTLLSRIDPRFMNVPVKVTEANALPVFTMASRMMSGLQLLLTMMFGLLVYQTVETSREAGSRLLMFPLYSFLGLMLVLVLGSILRMRAFVKKNP